MYNAHGDVVQLVNTMGFATMNYQYDAFGNEMGSVSNDANPFRYCGEYYDKETGTLYLRARNYDASIGRFTQQDDWWYADPNDPLRLNLYTYCGNNPVMYVDPDGHFFWIPIIIGVAIGAYVGGKSAYNSAVDRGLTGSDLFWATTKGAVEGAVIGGAIGAVVAVAAPYVAAFAGTTFTFGFGGGGLALAGWGSAGFAVTVTGTQILGAAAAAFAGTIMFAGKDPFVESLKRGMDQRQRDRFQREIEGRKGKDGRGGNDNLSKDALRDIADWIKETFKKTWHR